MSLIRSNKFSNSFRLNYFVDDEQSSEESYLLNLYKLLKKLSHESVVRKWDLYDIKSNDMVKYFDDADLIYKIHELNVSDLKEILKDHNLKSSGLKNDLLSRCIKNIPEEELMEYVYGVKLYKCNENVNKFLKENEYLDVYNEISSIYLSYFLSKEEYIKLFKDIPKEDIPSKILAYLFEYELNGSIGEYLTFLLATLDLYNFSEDLNNYLKNAIKIVLIFINDYFNFTEMQGWRTAPLVKNSNIFLEYSFRDIEKIFGDLNYLLNSYPDCDILENIIQESFNEISDQIPNLNQKDSIYYIVSSLLGKNLYNLLKENIPQNSSDCFNYFYQKQKVEYKINFIHYLNDVGKYRRHNSMDFSKRHFFNKSLDEGLIKLQEPSEALDYYDLNELKDNLLKYGAGYFTSKEQYRQWAKDNLTEEEIKESFPIKFYKLSDKGKVFLKNNIHYTFFKSTFYEIFSLDLSDYEPVILSKNHLNIDFADYEPIIPLEIYEDEIRNLNGLIKYIHEKTLNEDLKNQMWYKYARDLELLNNIYRINGSNEEDITKNFLKSFIIRFNGWYKEDKTNLDLVSDYNLQNYRYEDKYEEFFHEIYSSTEVPYLFFTEDEIKEYMKYPYYSFRLTDELEKRIFNYENGELIDYIPNYLGDYWIDGFIYLKEDYGFDRDSLNSFREELGIDFEDDSLNIKVNEFLIKLNELVSQNKLSQDEIKEELKEYTDLINIEGEKYSQSLRNERLNEIKLRRKIYTINNKARNLERMGNYGEAIKLYNETINIQDENSFLRFNKIFQYHRLLIIYRKLKDYDNELEICYNILDEYKKIIYENGDELFLDENSDEFVRKYKDKMLKEEKEDLKIFNEMYNQRKKDLKELMDYIGNLKGDLENSDKTFEDKKLLQNRVDMLENTLSYKQRDLKKLEYRKEEFEKEMDNLDNDDVFKIEDIILPDHVKEYQKYKKRLEKIKQLKEKSK